MFWGRFVKNYCFVLVLFLQVFSAMANNVEENFNFLLEAVKGDNFELANELIKQGIPTAISSDISQELEKKITGVSYKPECINIKELSLLTIIFWGFDSKFCVGQMIVNKKFANEIIEIFTELLRERYSIEKIRLINEYGAEDNESMLDNNSSALCCRVITGHEKKKNPIWSKHSYGIAIDINPEQNPYVKPYKDLILPLNGMAYIDRNEYRKGMIVRHDICYMAFTKRGWQWGGDWDPSPPNGRLDYQHFEKDLKDL